MKVVVNRCHGGFGLSDKAFERLIELGMSLKICNSPEEYNNYKGKAKIIKQTYEKGNIFSKYHFGKWKWDIDIELFRCEPLIIQVVEELGKKAEGYCASLEVVEIPDDIEFTIEEYDGYEWIAEKHQTW